MKDITGREYIYGIAQDKNGAPYLFNVGELVRCKDCEYAYIAQTDSREKMQRFCQRTPSFSRCVDDNDFCSWAKMKGGTE